MDRRKFTVIEGGRDTTRRIVLIAVGMLMVILVTATAPRAPTGVRFIGRQIGKVLPIYHFEPNFHYELEAP